MVRYGVEQECLQRIANLGTGDSEDSASADASQTSPSLRRSQPREVRANFREIQSVLRGSTAPTASYAQGISGAQNVSGDVVTFLQNDCRKLRAHVIRLKQECASHETQMASANQTRLEALQQAAQATKLRDAMAQEVRATERLLRNTEAELRAAQDRLAEADARAQEQEEKMQRLQADLVELDLLRERLAPRPPASLFDPPAPEIVLNVPSDVFSAKPPVLQRPRAHVALRGILRALEHQAMAAHELLSSVPGVIPRSSIARTADFAGSVNREFSQCVAICERAFEEMQTTLRRHPPSLQGTEAHPQAALYEEMLQQLKKAVQMAHMANGSGNLAWDPGFPRSISTPTTETRMADEGRIPAPPYHGPSPDTQPEGTPVADTPSRHLAHSLHSTDDDGDESSGSTDWENLSGSESDSSTDAHNEPHSGPGISEEANQGVIGEPIVERLATLPRSQFDAALVQVGVDPQFAPAVNREQLRLLVREIGVGSTEEEIDAFFESHSTGSPAAVVLEPLVERARTRLRLNKRRKSSADPKPPGFHVPSAATDTDSAVRPKREHATISHNSVAQMATAVLKFHVRLHALFRLLRIKLDLRAPGQKVEANPVVEKAPLRQLITSVKSVLARDTHLLHTLITELRGDSDVRAAMVKMAQVHGKFEAVSRKISLSVRVMNALRKDPESPAAATPQDAEGVPPAADTTPSEEQALHAFAFGNADIEFERAPSETAMDYDAKPAMALRAKPPSAPVINPHRKQHLAVTRASEGALPSSNFTLSGRRITSGAAPRQGLPLVTPNPPLKPPSRTSTPRLPHLYQ
eukprot:TRINITY_DN26846_c0_g1_i1.p1 TRINITY_DN26846_c0_g1~~TRINITY_DN26846_c0_g1_i1.p1  ORF type:complete len:811 (+),score=123.08 TRINITY_DN26846_c0_g1_i1:98-2530(+)